MRDVQTTDGRSIYLPANYDVSLPVLVAAVRVCLANEAVDVLPMLGVNR